ncbi:MAG: S8 family serine peptidase, partial [Asticcacaulis sp.]|nr:S8 family serine peptidase [Asticcacaulis sp.]
MPSSSTNAAPETGDDPLLYLQWYIDHSGVEGVEVDLNVRPVWDGGGGRGYSGAGVHVGIIDSLVERDHPDLVANYDSSLELDGLTYDFTASGHGTSVAGIIAAAKNGTGMTGIAYSASITSLPVIFSSSVNLPEFAHAMQHARDFDVVNMSLGGILPFDSWETRAYFATTSAYYRDAAENGRGGLGTV